MVALAALAGLIGDRGGQLVLYTVSVGTHTTPKKSEANRPRVKLAEQPENSLRF